MTVRIVLQARTTSSRLPAKALLPLGGIPLAVLCARRLRRGRIDVIVATSVDRNDDELTDTLRAAGLNVVRGSLDDVASRFIVASRDLADDDILVRATGDNPAADHDVVRAVLDDFAASDGDYLAMTSYGTVSYGGLVEVFWLGALRTIYEAGIDAYTAEHVTSVLAARNAVPVPDPARFDLGLGATRVTVDTLDDYLIAARAFRAFDDVVALSWQTAVARMHAIRTGA